MMHLSRCTLHTGFKLAFSDGDGECGADLLARVKHGDSVLCTFTHTGDNAYEGDKLMSGMDIECPLHGCCAASRRSNFVHEICCGIGAIADVCSSVVRELNHRGAGGCAFRDPPTKAYRSSRYQRRAPRAREPLTMLFMGHQSLLNCVRRRRVAPPSEQDYRRTSCSC